MVDGVPAWMADAVAGFGVACRDKLSGPGDREAAIRAPLEGLFGVIGSQLNVPAVFHDEVRETDRQVRPDYGVSVKGAITGYVEVKAPGKSIDRRPDASVRRLVRRRRVARSAESCL